MTLAHLATFNVNQFSSVKHQRADLLARMLGTDVVLCQETVGIDLTAFVSTVVGPPWGAYQERHGANDGHANTAVLYRLAGGVPTATGTTFLTSTQGERVRYLTTVQQGGVWYGSAHINPKRFAAGIPQQLAHLGAWVKAHPGPVVIGLDRNQCPPSALEHATGLTWHGVGIDGFLTNLPIANLKEFPQGFSDHPGVHAEVTLPAVTPPPKEPPVVASPSPKYLGPAAHTSRGNNKPIHRIVIHSTVSACEPGGAEKIARYFRTPSAGGSAHYVVDPTTEVQVVFDSVVAWHAPPNANSLGIEMCDTPGPVPTDKPGTAKYLAAKRAWRWLQPNQTLMLRRTAALAARLCAAYDVPTEFLTPADLLAGKHGITTHANVSLAFGESTHWDPGFWPQWRFMRLVRKEYAALTAQPAKRRK
jgi:hypothetical protein